MSGPAPSSGDDPRPLTHIRASGWAHLNLRELWAYRELVFFLTSRQVKGDYRQMALGPLWIVLRPLLGTLLFTFLFGNIAKVETDGVPYSLFCYTSLTLWTFFTAAAQGASQGLLQNRSLISKVYFPRLVIPLVPLLTASLYFFATIPTLALLMAYHGQAPGLNLLALPLYLLITGTYALALGLLVAPYIVHFRDLGQVVDYGLAGVMYISPVVYAVSSTRSSWHWVYDLNPFTHILRGFRWCVFGVGDPPSLALAIAAAIAIPPLIIGAYSYRAAERSIVDIA